MPVLRVARLERRVCRAPEGSQGSSRWVVWHATGADRCAGAVDADRLKQLVIIDLPGTVGFGVGSRASGTSDNDALPGPSSTATRSTTSAATGDSGGATSSTASGNRPPKRPIKIKLRPPPAAATSDGNASSDKSRKRRRTVADVSERIEELESQAARLSQQQTEYAPLKNTVGAQAVVSVNLTRRVTALVTERKEDLESRIPTMIKDALAEERARHESELARVEARLEEKHAAARAAEIKELGARLKAEYDAELEAIKTKVKEVIDIRMEHERGVWATAIDTWKQHERGLWATAIDTSIEDVVERCNDRGETERKRLEARLVAARAEELEDLEARVKASVAAERRSVVADRTAENAAKVQEMEHGLKDVKAEMARLRGQNTKHLEQRAEELRVWQDSFTQSRTADNFAIKRNVKDIIVFCGELRDTVTRLVDDVQGLRAQIGSGSGGSGAIAAALTPSDSSEEEEEEEGIIAALTMLQHHGAEH